MFKNSNFKSILIIKSVEETDFSLTPPSECNFVILFIWEGFLKAQAQFSLPGHGPPALVALSMYFSY